MIKRYPDLMSVVELSVATQAGGPTNLEMYRRQIRRVLRSDSLRAIDREIWALRDTAARLEKAGDWLGAGGGIMCCWPRRSAITATVQEMDEEGDIAMFVDGWPR
jgi:hypothetical protein